MKYLQASSLYFVVVISVVVLLLFIGLYLGQSFNQQGINKSKANIEFIETNNFLENYFSSTNQIDLESIQNLISSLDKNGFDSLSVNLSYWGIFKKISIEMSKGVFKFRNEFLVSRTIAKEYPAIYLKNDRARFTLSGKSTIYGNAWVPEGRVFPGSALTNSVNSGILITGNSYLSEDTIPDFNQEYIGDLYLFKQMIETELITFDSENLLATNDSFTNRIFTNDTLITLNSKCRMTNCILMAPKIIIESGFKGSVQCFSSKSIVVKNNVSLLYPSILYCEEDDTRINDTCKIDVGSNSKVAGMIVLKRNYHDNSFVNIDSCTFQGSIYCEGGVSLKGEIKGTVICDYLLSIIGRQTQRNNITNSNINRTLIPNYFAIQSTSSNEDYSIITKLR